MLGQNTLYSGGHVEFVKLADTVAMSRLSVASRIDVPSWQRNQ